MDNMKGYKNKYKLYRRNQEKKKEFEKIKV